MKRGTLMKNSVTHLSQGNVKSVGYGACALLLAACGGGSGTTEAPVAAAPPPDQLAATVSYNSALAERALYVSTTGSDSNAGTQAAPFKTIARAAQAATAGTVVHVAPGRYPGAPAARPRPGYVMCRT
jgi:hypothetical protein